MVVEAFPPVDLADEYGLLCVGGDLEVETLCLAYQSGIFPWPIAGIDQLTWFAPPVRAVLFLKELHISRSLKKYLSASSFTYRIDHDFPGVIAGCAQAKNRKDRGTWISKEIQDAYSALYRAGYAHSVECYEGGELVGGLYGVSIGGFFAGESMFYRKPNASKAAFIYLVDYLSSRGIDWIDCQVMTPHFKSLGAREILRADYMVLLKNGVEIGGRKNQQIF